MLELLLTGFQVIFTFKTILVIVLGVILGIIFGALPGISTSMGIAFCLPITYAMTATNAISMIIGLYVGGVSGGLITAILLNIPGVPGSISTTFDGHPMAARGEAGRALGIGITFSFLGGMVGMLMLFFIAPPLSTIALMFSPFEYFAVGVFSITLIAGLSGKSLSKGIVSGLIGILLSTIGIAPVVGVKRFTMGFHQFDGGISLLPTLIGVYAITEMLSNADSNIFSRKEILTKFEMKGLGLSLAEFKSQIFNFCRSSLIGVGIGSLPGLGAGVSNIVAYGAARNQSKHPEKFGTGIIDGIVASESSNNAVSGGALIPLLTLGIPGDSGTAMLLAGLMLHQIQPGPLLFETNGDIIYGIFAALIVANVLMFCIEYFGIRLFVKVLKVPKSILLPVIFSLCVVGAFGINNRMFDVWTILVFGLLGFGMSKFNYPRPPIVLGFILGPIIETNLLRGLLKAEGSFIPFLTRPISGFFILLTVLAIGSIVYKNIKKVPQNMKEA